MRAQGATAHSHPEMAAIIRVLKETSEAQKTYQTRLNLVTKHKNQHNDSSCNPDILRAQIQSFQLLARGLDVPDHIQGVLVKSVTPPSKAAAKQLFSQSPLETNFKQRQVRAELPPLGGFQPAQSVTGPCEKIISNRITARITELERLPANLGTLNLHNIDLDPAYKIPVDDDELKLKAVLELKALLLLTKQKSLRQHIVFNLASKSDPISESMNMRFSNRRIKVRSAHELRLTEQLEAQQRMERERRERQKHVSYITAIRVQANQVNADTLNKRFKRQNLGRSILNSHSNIEKEEQKRAERNAKQRLAALRSNDEEAYIKLLDQTKDTRITHLLRQTNSFLDSLAQAVKVQQADVSAPEPEMDVTDKEKIDYYKVAHRVKEEVRQPSILVGGTLKEYQVKGLQWMVSLFNNNLNGILADEMGLGKTIQSISLITYLIEVKRQRGPFLVIVPLSTLTNWVLEFEKWAPSVRKIVYKGPSEVRRIHQAQIRSGEFEVLLTTFEYIIRDRPILGKIKWLHMIIDEGHRMKNAQSKLSVTLTTYYSTRYRLILTGTPLQNSLPELWALLNFVLPKIFNSVKTFDDWFNTPFANTGGQDKIDLTEEESLLIIRRLHKVLRPFLLRRLKKDVEKDLPDKVENVIKCKMSALQTKLYDQMMKHNVLFVGESSKTGLKGLNNRIMQLRKICNHPFVFEEVEALVNPTKITNDNLWRVSGKFELLDRILPKLKRTNHRVLMFFQMTQIMDIMEDYMRYRGLRYLRLDGSSKADDRSEMLKLFNAPDSPYFAFLLSTRAGGLGLNLQTADTVIIYDTDWNPHQDLQAQDRAHRIGQKNEVRILRLITEASVEELILSRAHAKLEIDGKVIQAGKFDNKSTAEEQEAFLRSLLEAEEAKRHQKDEEDEIDDEDLNEILARGEEEAVLFNLMDKERNATSEFGKDKKHDRLMTIDELPKEYLKEIVIEPVREEILGRGARDRKRVYYDDGLTEEQFLEAVDKDAASLEAAIARKRARDEKRLERKQSKLDEEEAEDDDNDNDGQHVEEEPEEEEVPEPVTSSKRKRSSRKSSVIPAAAAATVIKTASEEPPALKKRAVAKGPTKPLVKAAGLELVELIQNFTTEDGRTRSDLFETLPDREDYPDYYEVIKKPTAVDTILARVERSAYRTFEGVRDDVYLMCENAFSYNEAGSEVYEDAQAIKNLTKEWWIRQEKAHLDTSAEQQAVVVPVSVEEVKTPVVGRRKSRRAK